jgi:RNA polymerase sigma factor (sigma-70 family)
MPVSKLFSETTIEEIIAQCVSNDTSAWEKFVKHFHGHVMFCALRENNKSGTSKNDVNELVQEVFLSLLSNDYKTLREFRGSTEAELNAYLSTIVYNISINLLRKEIAYKRKSISFNQLLDMSEQMIDDLSPDKILEDKLLAQEVQELLKSVLTGNNVSRDAFIFYLNAVVGLSARDIAKMPSISLSITNVQTIIRRTKEKLREISNKEVFRNL